MLYLLLVICTVLLIILFFKRKIIDESGVMMQSGELIVTGKDRVDIKLHQRPRSVVAHFGDDCEPIPCNPRDFDFLEYELHYIHGHFVLRITWDVSQMRKIFWEASR